MIVRVYHVIHLVEMYIDVHILLFHVLIELILVEVDWFVVHNHWHVVEMIVPRSNIQLQYDILRFFTFEPKLSSRVLRSVCVKSTCLVNVASSCDLALRRV